MRQFLCDILSKMASGRYVLTVACALVFAWVSIKKIIPADAVITILTMVFVSYFNRERGQNGGAK